MFDVSCIGVVTADVFAKPVEALPEKGLLTKVDQIQLSVGGCASNAAVALAKLGMKAQLFGRVGPDSFGRFVKGEIDGAGVDTEGLHIGKDSQTSSSVVAVNADGERSIMHCFGSNAEFGLADIDFEKIRRAPVLFIAGTFLLPSFDGEGARELLRRANAEGILCCLDTAWDPSGAWMDKIGGCLPYLDWFMPSFEEAVMLSHGKKDPGDIAEVFVSMGAKNVAIKLGERGCYVKTRNEKGFYKPAYADLPVADTSGAGDCFCAGFLTGLSKGWPPEKCAQFANAAGGMCVTAMGTTAGIKGMDETLAFIEKYKNEMR
ncbi:MAG: carbohydrate kinase family protein [Oscillospiraceae bacterium]|nr:carbohydrate kinase family protein [Oscillospiraceae bacterium]